jgi:hypothetical protein
MRVRIVALCGMMLAVGGAFDGVRAQDAGEEAPVPIVVRSGGRSFGGPGGGRPMQDFNELTRNAKTYEGYITLHEKDQHLYAEIKPMLLEQPILAPMMIARGSANAGRPLNFGDEWVLTFHRVGDNLQLIRKNIHFTAPQGTPLDKAVKQNYTDSILLSLPILSISPRGGGIVVDFADIFLTDFAQLGLGFLDRSRSRWFKIRAYPDNVEIQVEATYAGGRFGGHFFGGGPSAVVDNRGVTMVVHYSLCKAPDYGYHPRTADYRVGHFLNTITDFANPNPDTNAKRMINRWRLEKANPSAKLSPPKKQIVWYIEDTVPEEYRPYVQEGILEWNKAFEKIGFKDAIAVRWAEQGRDDFEPEDIHYCTLRWITTGNTFAMSGLRSNPLTGEMIDGDVIFDASWIKTWKEQYAFLVGMPVPTGIGQGDQAPGAFPVAVGEIISPIMAAKQGFGQFVPPPGSPRAIAWREALLANTNQAGADAPRAAAPAVALDVVPAGWDPIQAQLQQRLARGQAFSCNYAAAKSHEIRFAALALALPDTPAPPADKAKDEAKKKDGEKKDDGKKDKEKEKEKKEPKELKLPEEFLGQAIKETVMHEVGHSLGLRHNFRASAMLRPDQVHDTTITRVKGITGSVMDYNPINVAPRGQKQGDYCSTTIGPYDYWAIEYAYSPVMGNEEEALKKIAARSPDPELAFSTDEDLWKNDPLVNQYDLTSDTLDFGKSRMAMAAELLKDLDQHVVKDGDSWARLRTAFAACIDQYGNGAFLATEYIGGQSVHRDFKGSDKARDPVVPIAGARQREALKLLVDQVLSEKTFRFSPGLLRKLTTESWEDGGSSWLSIDAGYPIYRMILNIQEIVLDHCLDSGVLQRIQNQEMQSDEGSNPLKISEVFRSLSDGIFAEVGAPAAKEGTTPYAICTIRRNLQREYIKRLSAMVLGPRGGGSSTGGFAFVILFGSRATPPADAKNLARLHLEEIGGQIDKLLGQQGRKIDDTTLAHLKEIHFRIDKVLKANLSANEP